jgi:ketosteroid isomerase-like protein
MVEKEIKNAIDAANKKFQEGFLKQDSAINASIYSEDAIVFPPNSNHIQGKEAIKNFWKTAMDSGVKEANLTTLELTGNEEYVHERGTGLLKIQTKTGKPTQQKIKYVVVWKHTPEGWKNKWDIWNNAP